MRSDWFAVLDLGVAFGLVIGLLLWELRSLRRSQARDRALEQEQQRQREREADPDPEPETGKPRQGHSA